MGGATFEYPGRSCLQETDSPTHGDRNTGAGASSSSPSTSTKIKKPRQRQPNLPNIMGTNPMGRSARIVSDGLTRADKPTTRVQRRAPPHVYLNAPLPQRAPCARRRGGSCAALGRAADRSGGRRGEQRTHKIMQALASIAAHTTSLGTRGLHPPRLPGHWIHYHRDVL
jgi:hypothetical protein